MCTVHTIYFNEFTFYFCLFFPLYFLAHFTQKIVESKLYKTAVDVSVCVCNVHCLSKIEYVSDGHERCRSVKLHLFNT